MPYRVDIYIGSDNHSRRISREYVSRILEWANATFPQGYTLMKGRGHYRGASEDSLVVSVLYDCDKDLRDQLLPLKHTLGQEAILLAKSEVKIEVV